MNVKIMNYTGKSFDTGVPADEVKELFITIVSGDEIATIRTMDGKVHMIDSADLANNARRNNFYDGCYQVCKDEYDAWSKRIDSYDDWRGRLVKIENPSDLYSEIVNVAKSDQIGNWTCDLQCKVTKDTTAVINRYKYKHLVTTFHSAIDGTLWYEIPFAYNPWWEERCK